jgi:chemotaxis protein CheZ
MNDDNDTLESRLEKARILIGRIEAGDEEGIDSALDALVSMRESILFQEVGRLTRDLHNALNTFQTDARMTTLAENEMPDARARLNHVITMTDQAAHRTLNAVEEGLPLSDEIREKASTLGESWQRFRSRQMDAKEFRDLSAEISQFFTLATGNAERISSHLSDVLMAQDFQDLTGQVIRRVITLVQEVEDSLVNMIRLSGSRLHQGDAQAPAEGQSEALAGPAVPGTQDASDAVGSQVEVVDLLSSLGF